MKLYLILLIWKLYMLTFMTIMKPLISCMKNKKTSFSNRHTSKISIDLVNMVNICADYKNILKRPSSNIQFFLHVAWESVVQKDYFVVFTVSRFPYEMLRCNLTSEYEKPENKRSGDKPYT